MSFNQTLCIIINMDIKSNILQVLFHIIEIIAFSKTTTDLISSN